MTLPQSTLAEAETATSATALDNEQLKQEAEAVTKASAMLKCCEY